MRVRVITLPLGNPDTETTPIDHWLETNLGMEIDSIGHEFSAEYLRSVIHSQANCSFSIAEVDVRLRLGRNLRWPRATFHSMGNVPYVPRRVVVPSARRLMTWPVLSDIHRERSSFLSIPRMKPPKVCSVTSHCPTNRASPRGQYHLEASDAFVSNATAKTIPSSGLVQHQ